MNDPKKSAKRTTAASGKASEGFTAAERAAMRGASKS